MKNWLIILISSLLFLSCKDIKRVTKSNSKKTEVNLSTNTSFKVKTSGIVKMLIQDINKELSDNNISIENYNPTKTIIEKYNILLYNEEYFIQGFIKTNDQLNHNNFIKLNISTGVMMGDKATIRIPIKSFFQFLNITGVEYFEMNPKVELKL